MSAAVAFSKFRLGPLRPQVISKTCFCTPGTRSSKIGQTPCIEVPQHLFGKALESFVGRWDVKHLTLLERCMEVKLWGTFFADSRPYFDTKKMTIQRNLDDPFLFEAEIIEEGTHLSTLSKDAFNIQNPSEEALSSILEEEVKLFQTFGVRTKDKVSIYVENKLYPSSLLPKFLSNNVEHDTQEPFTHFLQKNRLALAYHFIDPLIVKEFSIATSVCKMTYAVDICGGIPIVQHFSEVKPQCMNSFEESIKDSDLLKVNF